MLAEAILQTALERSLTTQGAVAAIREELSTTGGPPSDEAVVERLYATGALSREAILQHLAEEFAMPVVNDAELRPTPEAMRLIDAETARATLIVPWRREGDLLHVALADPFALDAIDDLAHQTGCTVEPYLADAATLKAVIARIYGAGAGSEASVEGEDAALSAWQAAEAAAIDEAPEIQLDVPGGASGEDGPIVRYVQKLIGEAMRLRASDIHLEPMERRFRVRFRIDGRLREVENPPKRLQASIISRLKLMAQISIAEKRVPQDGRIRLIAAGKEIDLRVSSLPSVFGETIVMRILDKEGLQLGLPQLGFFSDDQMSFERIIAQPDGIFLVTGPTGSGKSTTLYAALNYINKPDRKIITVEDPVEYQLSGINQVQVRREIGMDFAAALRAMLRQAPNIIMVGEIRDKETAEIAINASLTGHMVFSTLHTNDAPSAVSRLVDIGIQPFLVAASLRGVLAQRLVRTVCAECGAPDTPSTRELLAAGLPVDASGDHGFRRGRGCVRCGGTGYRGRKGIFELFQIDEAMQQAIYGHSTLVELRRQARASGMRSMREDGFRKAIAGITTIDEVLAVTVEEPS